MPDLKIAPSILASDFGALGAEVEAVIAAGADMIHIDVMDGHFVPNISIGPPVVAALRKHSSVPMDVHLMISNPSDYVESFVDAGADIITFHIEAEAHPNRLISKIHELGCQAGIVLNPGTPTADIEYVVDNIEMALIMSVNPGFGGQTFIPETLRKIEAVRAMMGDRDVEVDGGVDAETAGACVEAGANVLVAGSYIFRQDSYAEAIESLRVAANV